MEWLGGMQKFFSRPQNPDFTKNIISHPGSTGKKKTVHGPKTSPSRTVHDEQRTGFRGCRVPGADPVSNRQPPTVFFGVAVNCVLQMVKRAMDPNHSRWHPPIPKGKRWHDPSPIERSCKHRLIWFCFGKWGYQNVVQNSWAIEICEISSHSLSTHSSSFFGPVPFTDLFIPPKISQWGDDHPRRTPNTPGTTHLPSSLKNRPHESWFL